MRQQMNLLSKLHNNYILTGPVDNYCLACDQLLRGQEKPFIHIDEPIHRENLLTTPILEKHKEDKIVKVKLGYYCIYCNLYFKTATNVKLHITDIDHTYHKNLNLLKCTDRVIIAFEDIVIQENAWHGLVENSCIICNKDFDSFEEHRKDKDHMFELIKSHCLIGENYVYRMVDDEAFFCVICAKVYSGDHRQNHHISSEHKDNFKNGQECHKSLNNVPKNKEIKPISSMETPKSSKSNYNEISNTSVDDCIKLDKSVNQNNNESVISKDLGAAQNIKKILPVVETNKDYSGANMSDTSYIIKSEDLSEKSACAVSQDDLMISLIPKHNKQKTKNTEDIISNDPKSDLVNKKLNTTDDTNEETTTSDANIAPVNKSTHKEKVDDFFESLEHSFYETVSHAKEIDPEMLKIYKIQLDNHFIRQSKNEQPWCELCLIHVKDGEIQQHIEGSETHNTLLEKHKRYIYKKIHGKCEDNTDKVSANEEGDKKENNKKKTAKAKDSVIDTKPKEVVSTSTNIALKDAKKTLGGKKKTEEQLRRNSTSSDNEMILLRKICEDKKNVLVIDFDANTTYCKHCNTNLEFCYASVKEHLKSHDDFKPFIEQNLLSQTAQYAFENYFDIVENNVSCTLCKVKVDTDLEAMKDHVNYYLHRNKVTEKTGSGPLTKMIAAEFMSYYFTVESSMINGIIINNMYFMTLKSFHTVSEIRRQLSCVICKMDLKQRNGDVFMDHIVSPEHVERLTKCNVVTSMPDEFIREIRPGVYHCGYCNTSFGSWHSAHAHTQKTAHASAKRHALWTLERCRPALRNAKPTLTNKQRAT